MIDLNKLLSNLTDKDIIEIMQSLGADRYQEQEDAIIFPTICHHEAAEDASMKLYYYKKNKKFHCYTDCSSNFNLFTLIEKVFLLQGGTKVNKKADKIALTDFCFSDIINYVINHTNVTINFNNTKKDNYISCKDKYKKKKRQIELPIFSTQVLDIFDKIYPAEWEQDGITHKAMDVFDIRFSISRNKIIIPHYNINNELIGIRGRALDKEEIETLGKYMPVEIENKWYKHPLSQNLYGLNLSKDNITRNKKVIIFEGEKSCLLYYGYFGQDNNISVACCGSSINKTQIDILMKNCQPDEIVLAFDKEFERSNDENGVKYFNKLYSLCEKYKNYANFSFIFDRSGLLNLKDSPVDRGIDIYKKLFESRVVIK